MPKIHNIGGDMFNWFKKDKPQAQILDTAVSKRCMKTRRVCVDSPGNRVDAETDKVRADSLTVQNA
jgi:hypothetical protein